MKTDLEKRLGKHLIRLPKPVQLKAVNCTAKGFKCLFCDLVFTSQKDLSTHLETEKKLYPCPICPTKSLSAKGMNLHFGKKHAKSRPYRCGICLKRFKNIYASRIHKQQVHMNSARIPCALCGKSLYNKYSLIRHKLVCKVSQKIDEEDYTSNLVEKN